MKKIILMLCVCFAWAVEGWPETLTRDEARARFVQAGIAYKDGRYAEAADLYEGVLTKGWESGPLYYNLANSYFRQADLGRAILNYERARRRIPRDHDLEANYRYALSLTKNNRSATGVWRRTVDHATGSFSADELAGTLAGLGIVLGMVHLWALYFSWPRRRKAVVLAGPLVVLVIVLSVSVLKFYAAADLAVVLTDSDGRFEPRDEATTYFELHAGGRVRIVKEYGAWVKVQRPDGKTGWVKREDVARI